MPSYTVKGIPEELYEKLRRRATANRRSINSEFIVCLQDAFKGQRADPESKLARADAVRERLNIPPYSEAELNAAKKRGRR